MHKILAALAALFSAMGRFSLTPGEGRTRPVYTVPEDLPSQQGIARHFEAAWRLLDKQCGQRGQKNG